MLGYLLPVVFALPSPVLDDTPAGMLGTNRWHFPAHIDALAAAPQGEEVAVSSGNTVFVLAGRTGEIIARHESPCAPIGGLAWTENGLVGGCNNTFLKSARLFMWRPGQNRPVFATTTPAPVVAVALLNEGAVVAAADKAGAVSAWRVVDGRSVATTWRPEADGAVRQAASAHGLRLEPGEDAVLTAEGGLLLRTGRQGDVLSIHDLLADVTVTSGHRAAITECAVAPDGERAATVDLDGVVHVWRIADGTLLDRWQVAPPEMDIVVPDEALVGWMGDAALVAGSGSGGVFQLRAGQRPAPRTEKRYAVHVRMDDSGNRGIFLARGGRAEVRQLKARGPAKVLWTPHGVEKQARRVRRADISGDGRTVLVVTSEVSVRDGATGALRWRGPGRDAALSHDGTHVAVWDGESVQVVQVGGGTRPIAADVERVDALALDATGRQLAVASPSGVVIYDVATGLPQASWQPGLPRRTSWLRFSNRHLLARAKGTPYVVVLPLATLKEGALAPWGEDEDVPGEAPDAEAPDAGDVPDEDAPDRFRDHAAGADPRPRSLLDDLVVAQP